MRAGLATAILLLAAAAAHAQDTTAVERGTVPFSGDPDYGYEKKRHLFPLFQDKLKPEVWRKLPPAYGVMYLNNWMQSDWEFTSAAVSLGGPNPISLDAAEDATMQLDIQTNGVKADLWVLPFLDLMIGGGMVDVEVELGLRDIPVDYDVVAGDYTRADAIIPMEFDGTYYSFGFVPAGGYKNLYFAADVNWVKTNLEGSASLSTSGFWTFTAAPKFGYNAGLSQIYIGARYISKNEQYTGTVDLASGNPLSFDVHISTHSWAPNAGMRTVIRNHLEVLLEVAGGRRHQATAGIGYRW
jgi:hypothetical protein